MEQGLDRSACYRALKLRDARFDGRFFTAVTTTGIYCRPICPARTPRSENCLFLPSAAAAHAAGYRPCLRCRPEAAPGVAAWTGTASTVTRALALIAEGGLDGGDLDALAGRLGIGGRQLRRLFLRHVGAPPVAVAQARRLLFAKALLADSALPMTDVALAAGYASLRRFNEAVRDTFGRAPSQLRRGKRATSTAAVELRLPFSPPFDWPALLGWFAARAIPGVESVEGATYRRTIAIENAEGEVEVRLAPGARHLDATVRLSNIALLAQVAARLRRLFDLDADARGIARHLGRDALLAPLVKARPGLRVPGAWDAFELAVRAILGQQITVGHARDLAGRLTGQYGKPLASAREGSELLRLFPTPQAVAGADVAQLGMPRARGAAISSLAAAAVTDPTLLQPAASLEQSVERLCELPGVGPWTAHYIAMRALREPDALPASDLGLLHGLADLGKASTPAALLAYAERWRPYRAYGAMHLWMGAAK